MNQWRYSKSDLANWRGAELGNRLASLALMDSESGNGEAPGSGGGSSRRTGPGASLTYCVPAVSGGAMQSLPDFETAVHLASRGGGGIGVKTGSGANDRAPRVRGVRDIPAAPVRHERAHSSTGKNDRSDRGLPVGSASLNGVRGGHATEFPVGGGDGLHARGGRHASGPPVGGDLLDARGSLPGPGRPVGSDLVDTLGGLGRDLVDTRSHEYTQSTRGYSGRELPCDVVVPPPEPAAVRRLHLGDGDGIFKRNASGTSIDTRVLPFKKAGVADSKNAALEKTRDRRSDFGNGASSSSVSNKNSPIPVHLHREAAGRRAAPEPELLADGSPVNFDTTASMVTAAAAAANAAAKVQPGDVMRDYLGERGLLLPWSGRKTPVPQDCIPSCGSGTSSAVIGARAHSPGSQARKLMMPVQYEMRVEAAPSYDIDTVTKGLPQRTSANGGSVSSAKAALSQSILAAEGLLSGAVANGESVSRSIFGGHLHGASADSGWSSSSASLQSILTNAIFHGASACSGSQLSAASLQNLVAAGVLHAASANGGLLPNAVTKFAPSTSSLDSSHAHSLPGGSYVMDSAHPGNVSGGSYLMENGGGAPSLDSSHPGYVSGGSYLMENGGGAPSSDAPYPASLYHGSMANQMAGTGAEPSFDSSHPAAGCTRYRPKLTGNVGTRDRRHRRQRSKNKFGASGITDLGQGKLVIARGVKSISILTNGRHPVAADRDVVPLMSNFQDTGSNSVIANTNSAEWALLNSSPYLQWDWASQNAFIAASVHVQQMQQTMQVAVHQAMQLHAMQHALQETEPDVGVLPSGKFKSQMCNAWMVTGLCPLMGFCEFAHGAHELQSVLPNWASQLGMCKQGQLKTELCNNWDEVGSCPYGTSCRFAHGEDELRIVVRHPRYKTVPCRMILNGVNCIYGDRCHFRHQLTTTELSLISIIDISRYLFPGILFRNIHGFYP